MTAPLSIAAWEAAAARVARLTVPAAADRLDPRELCCVAARLAAQETHGPDVVDRAPLALWHLWPEAGDPWGPVERDQGRAGARVGLAPPRAGGPLEEVSPERPDLRPPLRRGPGDPQPGLLERVLTREAARGATVGPRRHEADHLGVVEDRGPVHDASRRRRTATIWPSSLRIAESGPVSGTRRSPRGWRRWPHDMATAAATSAETR